LKYCSNMDNFPSREPIEEVTMAPGPRYVSGR